MKTVNAEVRAAALAAYGTHDRDKLTLEQLRELGEPHGLKPGQVRDRLKAKGPRGQKPRTLVPKAELLKLIERRAREKGQTDEGERALMVLHAEIERGALTEQRTREAQMRWREKRKAKAS